MNASWNGRQIRFAGTSAVAIAVMQLQRFIAAAQARQAIVCTRCCHIAWLANRNASATSGSASDAMPARIRAATSRATLR